MAQAISAQNAHFGEVGAQLREALAAKSVQDAAAASGPRKGGIVVDLRSLPNQPGLVVEAKNRPGRAALSSGQWAQELDHSLSARSADVAIGVCPVDQMPGLRHVLVIDSTRAVVAWDPDSGDDLVTAVYLLMRMCAGYQRRDTAVSPAELEQHVQAVVTAIAPLDEIQRQAVACRRSAERIDAVTQALRTDLKARIDTMCSRIEEAAGTSEAVARGTPGPLLIYAWSSSS